MSEEKDIELAKRERSTVKGKFTRDYNRIEENMDSKEFDMTQRERAEQPDVRPKVQANSAFRVKRLEPPTFSEDIRKYPGFLRDFERHMVPSFGHDPYAFKSCLTGEALESVLGVDDDYYKMMDRLESKYGASEILTDVVLRDLKQLRDVADDNPQSFVQMVSVVERCWLDLRQPGLCAELNNATVVNKIERLMPSVQKREWILRKRKSDYKTDTNKFKSFLDFLLEEKSAAKYLVTCDERPPHKHKAHNILSNTEERSDKLIGAMEKHLAENQKLIKQMVESMARTSVGGQNNNNHDNDFVPGRRCWYHKTDSHDIGSCTAFGKMTVKERLDILRQNGGCFSCLRLNHRSSTCMGRKPCEIADNSGRACGRMHHPSLHTDNNSAYSYHNSSRDLFNESNSKGPVILMLSKVMCKDQRITTLWDSGSDMSLITHRMAKTLGLKGTDVTLTVTKVGNVTETIRSKLYNMPLLDLKGNCWFIHAYGMEEVTAEVGFVDVNPVVSLFAGITLPDIERPTGNVGLLIGTDCCQIMPAVVQQVGNLQLMMNSFGYCLRGSHDLIVIQKSASLNVIRIHMTMLHRNSLNDVKLSKSDSIKECLDRFYEVESLGVSCTPRCGGCKGGKYPLGGKNFTIEEERELAMIEKGLYFDQLNNKWTVEYPWRRNPEDLPNNYVAALARLSSTEKRVSRIGTNYAQKYADQIDDMVKRDVARKLSKRELDEYRGPIHYIPHHEIIKADSESTPVRIVFNSSSSFMGHVLNEYWVKGPNVINDLLGVLLRFREGCFAIVGDISKMYNSIAISKLDQNTHRFLWRDLACDREPDHYILQAVTFGDKPSGTITMVAMRLTAEMMQSQFPEAVNMVTENSYVGDILKSVDSINEAEKLACDAEQVLTRGGFNIKHWRCSWNSTSENSERFRFLEAGEEKVLGMRWQPHTDGLVFKVRINFSTKYKGVRTDGDLQRDDIPQRLPLQLTRRTLLSQVASIYDPLGLITPFVVEAKCLMRGLSEHASSDIAAKSIWDQPVAERDRREWITFFHKLFEIENLFFPRCLKPSSAREDPTLVIFSDGSITAYGACAYVQWEVADGQFESRLVMSKNRIAPTRQLSVPRLELSGAVLASRMREKIVQEMDYVFQNIFHITDSMIVRAQIQKSSYGFGTFVATRVAEIQSKTSPAEWWWVQSEFNVAEMTTRPNDANMLGSESVWQRGPSYLRLPTEQWPVRQDCEIDTNKLPDRIGMVLSSRTDKSEHLDIGSLDLGDIDYRHFGSWEHLIRTVAVLMIIARNKSFKGVKHYLNAESLESAENEIIKYAQRSLPTDWQYMYRQLGPAISDEGIIVVGSRMQDWIKLTWNRTHSVLLHHDSPVTQLLLDHCGVESTLAKLRSKFWIPGVRRLIKATKKKCVICRRIEKLEIGQQMGRLPRERMVPSPPFSYCDVDLFGPFEVKDTVRKRVRGKAYGVIFNCLTCRAVYVDMAEGYDTDSFLVVFRRFVAQRGYPKSMLSDSGSPLVSASKELAKITTDWNWDQIKHQGSKGGMA